MSSQLLLQTIANAIAASGMLALIAVGLTLAFGVMQMANLAHGHFFMIGAYTVYALYALGGWPFWLAVAAAVAVGAIIGLIVERGIFRPLQGDVVSGFIATAGLMFVFEVLVGEIWGWGLSKPIPSPYMKAFRFMGAAVSFQRVLVIPFAFISIGGLMFFMRRFRLGRALRAVAQDPEAASLQGININRMTSLALAIAGAYAGLAGGADVDHIRGYPLVGRSHYPAGADRGRGRWNGKHRRGYPGRHHFRLCHDFCNYSSRRRLSRHGFGDRYGTRIGHQTTRINGP